MSRALEDTPPAGVCASGWRWCFASQPSPTRTCGSARLGRRCSRRSASWCGPCRAAGRSPSPTGPPTSMPGRRRHRLGGRGHAEVRVVVVVAESARAAPAAAAPAPGAGRSRDPRARRRRGRAGPSGGRRDRRRSACPSPAGSASANQGRSSAIRLSQPTLPAPTSCATTVAPTDFDTEASWNTVSASTGVGLARLAQAETLGVGDAAVHHHRDGDAGDAGPGAHVLDQPVELADRPGDLPVRDRHARGLRRRRHLGPGRRRQQGEPADEEGPTRGHARFPDRFAKTARASHGRRFAPTALLARATLAIAGAAVQPEADRAAGGLADDPPRPDRRCRRRRHRRRLRHRPRRGPALRRARPQGLHRRSRRRPAGRGSGGARRRRAGRRRGGDDAGDRRLRPRGGARAGGGGARRAAAAPTS